MKKKNKLLRKLLRVDAIILIIFGFLSITAGFGILIDENQTEVRTHLDELSPYLGIFLILIGSAIAFLAYDTIQKNN